MVRAGGEADKFGNSYEGAWTIFCMLLVLAGRAQAITVEDVGDLGEGSEFTLTSLHHGDEAHQVKRRQGTANGWTPHRLNNEGVLQAARKHVEQGRQFHFVSMIPAPKVDGLARDARRSASVEAFLADWLKADLKTEFTYLSGDIYGSDQVAWQTLCGIWTHCQDEDALRRMIGALAGLLIAGAPAMPAALSLGDLAIQNLGVRLTAVVIEKGLAEYALSRAQLIGNPAVAQSVDAVLASWKASVERDLLKPAITRDESGQLSATLRSNGTQVTIVVGAAGAGKSGVLRQSAQELQMEGWPVLAFRLDRLESMTSTAEVGDKLGLGTSPVTALAAAAAGDACLLVIDQLDAVSFASGRMPSGFHTVVDLIQEEAAAFPQMRVLLACRAFDLDNDHRIRQLVADKLAGRLEVHPLTDEQVDAAVDAMGLPAAQLTAEQRSLFASPLNLVLLSAIADEPDALAFDSSGGLLAAYWDRKRRDCASRRPQSPPRYEAVIGTLANAMSERQQLTARISVLDADGLTADAEVLASEHVLVQDGQRYAFFHGSFFDYAFARLWLDRDEGLAEFLLDDKQEQELFRRAQVRQILLHIREDNPERFIREAEAVLAHPRIRFHIKAVVLAVLRSLADPASAEWQMIERLLAADPDGPLTPHLWAAISTVAWFDRLDGDGVVAGWLASGNAATYDRAMQAIVGAVKPRTDRMAQLIAPYAGASPQYPNWLAWISRFADVHTSRPLFDLLLEAVRRGDYNGRPLALWNHVYGLGQHQPGWAVELLATWLVSRPGALAQDASGRPADLEAREHNLLELASCGAQGAPALYVQRLIPYLLMVMELTKRDPAWRPAQDHFSFRQEHPGPMPVLGDALLHGAATALRTLAAQDEPALQPTLDLLAVAPYDSAQWLLYEALRANGERYAERAAGLLLEGEHRFPSGYLSSPYWTARQLLQATTPHMPGGHFTRLEAAIMAYAPAWESRDHAGWASFILLSALAEDRLSRTGQRRLGELRRRFNTVQPALPAPTMLGGFVRSPIPPASAKLMTDDEWLRAMDKYRTDRTDYGTLTGGVDELSSVLRSEAASDPARFARLSLRMTAGTHPSYVTAILDGLMQTQHPVDSALVFDVARHVAALGNDGNDQALTMALRQHLAGDVPDDITALVLDRALRATDPAEDAWSQLAPNGQPYHDGDIATNGMNCARGQAALILGDLLIHDTDGHRTRLVAPSLAQLAADPSVAVRSSVAHVLSAAFWHAPDEALAAFELLIAADDRLLATNEVVNLLLRIGTGRPAVAEAVIQRMLASPYAQVQQRGGFLAAQAGLESGLGHLLAAARASGAEPIRQGAADLCARILPRTSDAAATVAALQQFFADEDDEVRKAAAQVVAVLRNHPLQPFRELLSALVASRSFTEALPQLLYTLQAAPDRIDETVVQCTQRFIDIHGKEAGDISTSAARDAQMITQLTLRAYAQAPDRKARNKILDLIDGLLLINAIGALEAVDQAER
jgi:hypothetical protein